MERRRRESAQTGERVFSKGTELIRITRSIDSHLSQVVATGLVFTGSAEDSAPQPVDVVPAEPIENALHEAVLRNRVLVQESDDIGPWHERRPHFFAPTGSPPPREP